MRTVPLAVAVLLALAAGAGGWWLGRTGREPGSAVEGAAARAESAPIPRPVLEAGRGGRSGGPGGQAPPRRREPDATQATRDPAPPPSVQRPEEVPPAAADAVPPFVLPRGWQVGIDKDGAVTFGGGTPAPEAPPEPPAVVEAQRLMRSSPEEAVPRLEALLESRDAVERAAAYRLLGAARHPSHRPLVERAHAEATSEDQVRSLLDALAQFKGPKWAAVQMTGPPDTPLAGDLVTAWASKSPEMGPVWVELEYAEAVTPEQVRVHETQAPGAVARILGQRADGTWVALWEGTAAGAAAPTWFEPRLESVRFATQRIRLIVDTDRVEGWNEIDAVELVGDGRRQWALRATAASSYAD